ncbi:MAG: hypothetical protein GYA36_19425 [Veillonellaceae bacterium]|nr:hypothetical protein [Veillonellaceae bacterium]
MKKHPVQRKGHWGYPKCGCPSASRVVHRPTYIPILFTDEAYTELIPRKGKPSLLKKTYFWGHKALGDAWSNQMGDRFQNDYICPACDHRYKKPKWHCR